MLPCVGIGIGIRGEERTHVHRINLAYGIRLKKGSRGRRTVGGGWLVVGRGLKKEVRRLGACMEGRIEAGKTDTTAWDMLVSCVRVRVRMHFLTVPWKIVDA